MTDVVFLVPDEAELLGEDAMGLLCIGYKGSPLKVSFDIIESR